MDATPKLETYSFYKRQYEKESYCEVMLKRWQRSLLAKLRLGIFPINLELGRYNGIPRQERWGTLCNKREIENELHILFHCPIYNNERCKLLDHAANTFEGFVDLNDNEKVHILVSNIIIITLTITWPNARDVIGKLYHQQNLMYSH